MKVLITNLWLDGYGGSESWCYAVASELLKRGYIVDVYTPMCGRIYKEFEKLGVKFSDGGVYDLILENHCVLNKDKFIGPVIHTCHGIIKEEGPMTGVTNVAVSKKAAERWNLDTIIQNGIDVNRFTCKTSLHTNIKKVLSLCKSDTANGILRKICSDIGVEFECMYGKEVFNVEDKINEADIVVGVGRSLLDAMACGRPVVSFDDRFYYKTRMLGYGYITPDKYKYYDLDSFTASYTGKTLNKLELAKEIFEKYDPKDGEVNRQYIIDNLSIKKTVDEYLALYEKIKTHSKQVN